MARLMVVNTSHMLSKTTWDPQRALECALQERARFLEMHPQYIEYQCEIDRILDKAGGAENRMTVLALLIEAKLVELHAHFKDLNSILVSVL